MTTKDRKELAEMAPNMVEMFKTYGEEAMTKKLTEIAERHTVEVLQALAMGSHLDSTRKAYGWKDKVRLVEFIVRRAKARYTKGDCYLTYEG